jgi:hypothetical protein
MKTKLPEHIEAQLYKLIAERLPAEQIAFMMRLDRRVVEEAINTTKEKAAASGSQSR